MDELRIVRKEGRKGKEMRGGLFHLVGEDVVRRGEEG
jgi:hypothetical protein